MVKEWIPETAQGPLIGLSCGSLRSLVYKSRLGPVTVLDPVFAQSLFYKSRLGPTQAEWGWGCSSIRRPGTLRKAVLANELLPGLSSRSLSLAPPLSLTHALLFVSLPTSLPPSLPLPLPPPTPPLTLVLDHFSFYPLLLARSPARPLPSPILLSFSLKGERGWPAGVRLINQSIAPSYPPSPHPLAVNAVDMRAVPFRTKWCRSPRKRGGARSE